MARNGWVAAAFIVLVAGVIGASGQQEAHSGEVVLRFSWWGGEARHNAILDAIALFEESNPGVRIEPEFGGWSGYIDKLATQMAVGQQPDVFYAGIDGPWTALPAGERVDLTAVETVRTDALDPVQLAMAYIDGGLVGLPRTNALRGFAVNATVFEELDIEMPAFDWTWEEFADVAQRVYDRSDGTIHGVLDESGGITYNSFGGRAWWISHFGTTIITAEGIQLTRDQLIEYYRWWGELRDSGAATAAAITVSADDNQNNPLVTRNAAMVALASGSLGRIQSSTTDDIVLYPFPTAVYPSDEVLPGMLLSISTRTEYPDEAAAFLDFMINDVEAGKIIGTTMGVSSNADRVAALLASNIDRTTEKVFEHYNHIVENRETIPGLSAHPALGEFYSRRYVEEQMLAFDQVSVEQAVDGILAAARELGVPVR